MRKAKAKSKRKEKMVALQCYFTPLQVALLRRLSKQNGASVAWYLREAASEYIARHWRKQ